MVSNKFWKAVLGLYIALFSFIVYLAPWDVVRSVEEPVEIGDTGVIVTLEHLLGYLQVIEDTPHLCPLTFIDWWCEPIHVSAEIFREVHPCGEHGEGDPRQFSAVRGVYTEDDMRIHALKERCLNGDFVRVERYSR